MGEWMVASQLATEETLQQVKNHATEFVRKAKENAWKGYTGQIKSKTATLSDIYNSLDPAVKTETIRNLETDLKTAVYPAFSDVLSNARKLSTQLKRFNGMKHATLESFISENKQLGQQRYHTHLHSETLYAALNVPEVPAKFTADTPVVSGFQVLNAYFDQLFSERKDVVAFGEDVGRIGDVNQGFAGLQLKYGSERIFDTGIREWTIMGQALGGAMRGLRTIAEIQYLDYMAYAFSLLTDDLATLRYRSNGIQRAPTIIRTRGHRLEGIWHAGSPMGMMITSMQGIYLCVPRNMVQAVGFYNTLLASDDPGIIVECLNGYRLKEALPENLLEYTIPLGVPEIITEGNDVTLVTYGSCVREAQKGVDVLKGFNISVELIDARTLMPFDIRGIIVESLKKTNRIVFMDEDIPGGATSCMMRDVLEKWDGYRYLDVKPITLTAAAHRTPFGSDGDYFSKPGADDVVETVLQMMNES
jgi:pyruvate/2-oxoglutarate/acetoin dehydrogenase E1 component